MTATTPLEYNVIKEYIVILRDDLVKIFFDDNEMRSVGHRTNCTIELTKRILNRKLGDYKIVKYAIIRVKGADDFGIRQCNRLLEQRCPPYRNRQEYIKKSRCCTIYAEEFSPDNASLYFQYQRSGATTVQFGKVTLKSPFGLNNKKSFRNCYWRLNNSDLKKGIHIASTRQAENFFSNYLGGKIATQESFETDTYSCSLRTRAGKMEKMFVQTKNTNSSDYKDYTAQKTLYLKEILKENERKLSLEEKFSKNNQVCDNKLQIYGKPSKEQYNKYMEKINSTKEEQLKHVINEFNPKLKNEKIISYETPVEKKTEMVVDFNLSSQAIVIKYESLSSFSAEKKDETERLSKHSFKFPLHNPETGQIIKGNEFLNTVFNSSEKRPSNVVFSIEEKDKKLQGLDVTIHYNTETNVIIDADILIYNENEIPDMKVNTIENYINEKDPMNISCFNNQIQSNNILISEESSLKVSKNTKEFVNVEMSSQSQMERSEFNECGIEERSQIKSLENKEKKDTKMQGRDVTIQYHTETNVILDAGIQKNNKSENDISDIKVSTIENYINEQDPMNISCFNNKIPSNNVFISEKSSLKITKDTKELVNVEISSPDQKEKCELIECGIEEQSQINSLENDEDLKWVNVSSKNLIVLEYDEINLQGFHNGIKKCAIQSWLSKHVPGSAYIEPVPFQSQLIQDKCLKTEELLQKCVSIDKLLSSEDNIVIEGVYQNTITDQDNFKKDHELEKTEVQKQLKKESQEEFLKRNVIICTMDEVVEDVIFGVSDEKKIECAKGFINKTGKNSNFEDLENLDIQERLLVIKIEYLETNNVISETKKDSKKETTLSPNDGINRRSTIDKDKRITEGNERCKTEALILKNQLENASFLKEKSLERFDNKKDKTNLKIDSMGKMNNNLIKTENISMQSALESIEKEKLKYKVERSEVIKETAVICKTENEDEKVNLIEIENLKEKLTIDDFEKEKYKPIIKISGVFNITSTLTKEEDFETIDFLNENKFIPVKNIEESIEEDGNKCIAVVNTIIEETPINNLKDEVKEYVLETELENIEEENILLNNTEDEKKEVIATPEISKELLNIKKNIDDEERKVVKEKSSLENMFRIKVELVERVGNINVASIIEIVEREDEKGIILVTKSIGEKHSEEYITTTKAKLSIDKSENISEKYKAEKSQNLKYDENENVDIEKVKSCPKLDNLLKIEDQYKFKEAEVEKEPIIVETIEMLKEEKYLIEDYNIVTETEVKKEECKLVNFEENKNKVSLVNSQNIEDEINLTENQDIDRNTSLLSNKEVFLKELKIEGQIIGMELTLLKENMNISKNETYIKDDSINSKHVKSQKEDSFKNIDKFDAIQEKTNLEKNENLDESISVENSEKVNENPNKNKNMLFLNKSENITETWTPEEFGNIEINIVIEFEMINENFVLESMDDTKNGCLVFGSEKVTEKRVLENIHNFKDDDNITESEEEKMETTLENVEIANNVYSINEHEIIEESLNVQNIQVKIEEKVLSDPDVVNKVQYKVESSQLLKNESFVDENRNLNDKDISEKETKLDEDSIKSGKESVKGQTLIENIEEIDNEEQLTLDEIEYLEKINNLADRETIKYLSSFEGFDDRKVKSFVGSTEEVQERSIKEEWKNVKEDSILNIPETGTVQCALINVENIKNDSFLDEHSNIDDKDKFIKTDEINFPIEAEPIKEQSLLGNAEEIDNKCDIVEFENLAKKLSLDDIENSEKPENLGNIETIKYLTSFEGFDDIKGKLIVEIQEKTNVEDLRLIEEESVLNISETNTVQCPLINVEDIKNESFLDENQDVDDKDKLKKEKEVKDDSNLIEPELIKDETLIKNPEDIDKESDIDEFENLEEKLSLDEIEFIEKFENLEDRETIKYLSSFEGFEDLKKRSSAYSVKEILENSKEDLRILEEESALNISETNIIQCALINVEDIKNESFLNDKDKFKKENEIDDEAESIKGKTIKENLEETDIKSDIESENLEEKLSLDEIEYLEAIDNLVDRETIKYLSSFEGFDNGRGKSFVGSIENVRENSIIEELKENEESILNISETGTVQCALINEEKSRNESFSDKCKNLNEVSFHQEIKNVEEKNDSFKKNVENDQLDNSKEIHDENVLEVEDLKNKLNFKGNDYLEAFAAVADQEALKYLFSFQGFKEVFSKISADNDEHHTEDHKENNPKTGNKSVIIISEINQVLTEIIENENIKSELSINEVESIKDKYSIDEGNILTGFKPVNEQCSLLNVEEISKNSIIEEVEDINEKDIIEKPNTIDCVDILNEPKTEKEIFVESKENISNENKEKSLPQIDDKNLSETEEKKERITVDVSSKIPEKIIDECSIKGKNVDILEISLNLSKKHKSKKAHKGVKVSKDDKTDTNENVISANKEDYGSLSKTLDDSMEFEGKESLSEHSLKEKREGGFLVIESKLDDKPKVEDSFSKASDETYVLENTEIKISKEEIHKNKAHFENTFSKGILLSKDVEDKSLCNELCTGVYQFSNKIPFPENKLLSNSPNLEIEVKLDIKVHFSVTNKTQNKKMTLLNSPISEVISFPLVEEPFNLSSSSKEQNIISDPQMSTSKAENNEKDISEKREVPSSINLNVTVLKTKNNGVIANLDAKNIETSCEPRQINLTAIESISEVNDQKNSSLQNKRTSSNFNKNDKNPRKVSFEKNILSMQKIPVDHEKIQDIPIKPILIKTELNSSESSVIPNSSTLGAQPQTAKSVQKEEHEVYTLQYEDEDSQDKIEDLELIDIDVPSNPFECELESKNEKSGKGNVVKLDKEEINDIVHHTTVGSKEEIINKNDTVDNKILKDEIEAIQEKSVSLERSDKSDSEKGIDSKMDPITIRLNKTIVKEEKENIEKTDELVRDNNTITIKSNKNGKSPNTIESSQLLLQVSDSSNEQMVKDAVNRVTQKSIQESLGKQKELKNQGKYTGELQTITRINDLNEIDIIVQQLSKKLFIDLLCDTSNEMLYPEIKDIDLESESSLTLFSINFEIPFESNNNPNNAEEKEVFRLEDRSMSSYSISSNISSLTDVEKEVLSQSSYAYMSNKNLYSFNSTSMENLKSFVSLNKNELNSQQSIFNENFSPFLDSSSLETLTNSRTLEFANINNVELNLLTSFFFDFPSNLNKQCPMITDLTTSNYLVNKISKIQTKTQAIEIVIFEIKERISYSRNRKNITVSSLESETFKNQFLNRFFIIQITPIVSFIERYFYHCKSLILEVTPVRQHAFAKSHWQCNLQKERSIYSFGTIEEMPTDLLNGETVTPSNLDKDDEKYDEYSSKNLLNDNSSLMNSSKTTKEDLESKLPIPIMHEIDNIESDNNLQRIMNWITRNKRIPEK